MSHLKRAIGCEAETLAPLIGPLPREVPASNQIARIPRGSQSANFTAPKEAFRNEGCAPEARARDFCCAVAQLLHSLVSLSRRCTNRKLCLGCTCASPLCCVLLSETKSPEKMSNDTHVIRIKPLQYIHVLDNNTNVSRVEVGPQTFTRQVR